MSAHDIHVSVCDINIEDNEVEIVLKTFLDDLQIALGLTPGEELPDDYSSSEAMIIEYVQEKIRFSSGNMDYSLQLEEISASMEAVWISMKMTGVSDDVPAEIEVNNSFLTEVYRDQTNLINLRKDGVVKSVAMDRKKQTAVLRI